MTQREGEAQSVLRRALDDLEATHVAWMAGWTSGYAEGRKAHVEEMARALLHEQATIATGIAVETARQHHGEHWAQAIREQAEVVMSEGRIYVYSQRSNLRYTLVRGMIRDWLIRRRIPAMWSPTYKGWHVRTERVGDLIAQAEHDGYRVRMKGELR